MSEERYDDIIVITDDLNHSSDVPPTEEEFAKAEEILSASEDIARQNKEELEQLESPLIVHKLTDASYEETASGVEMEETHADDDGPTLERHRFRKEQKNSSKGWKILLFVVLVAVAVVAGLYYGGVIDFGKQEPTSEATTEKTTQATTSLEQAFKGKIVVKDIYIFVDGVEVDGIEGLQKALKYEEPSPNAYEIVKENANSNFLNNDILPAMLDMGFYDETTVITTIASSGLIAYEETTTVKVTKPKKNKGKSAKKTEKALIKLLS